ncbi:hypothetical protein OIU34_19070 [Pararhizobium sp. BT-229]|uniref:hypothetical protein n=1 Tax=Pararhizobium sp. BT-229 TaxID=2986923 RepID=UPI0021F6AEDE|nr:hypothetical protein [Pararhizobium sp. BT-229]MCV9963984.1 hypothetical protein [Pararhizobium sp. BT-229]
MTLFYAAAAWSLVSGLGSMALAVVTAEEGRKRLSLAYYLGSVALIVWAATIMAAAHAKP